MRRWQNYSGKILVGTRSYQKIKKKNQFHYNYGTKKYLYQLDLCDLFGKERSRISELNNGAQYILAFMNCLTKKVYAYPLKSRTNADIISVLKQTFRDAKIGCKNNENEISNIQVDKEFLTNELRNFFKKNCINAYHSESDFKASMIERWIRTLKEGLVARLEGNYTERWLEPLQDFVTQYNENLVHSSTKLTPNMAEMFPSVALVRISESMAKKSNKKYVKNRKFRFKIGDMVRLRANKDNNPFIKYYRRRFTAETYTVYRRRSTKYANVYYVKDRKGNLLDGALREDYLESANDRNEVYAYKILDEKKDKVLIAWDGFSESDNQWIAKKDLDKLRVK